MKLCLRRLRHSSVVLESGSGTTIFTAVDALQRVTCNAGCVVGTSCLSNLGFLKSYNRQTGAGAYMVDWPTIHLLPSSRRSTCWRCAPSAFYFGGANLVDEDYSLRGTRWGTVQGTRLRRRAEKSQKSVLRLTIKGKGYAR